MRLESYGKLCTQVYDISKPEPPPDAFGYYLDLCKTAGGPVLEPMCGSGRFLIPLLENGIDIDGADASPQMLQACLNKCLPGGLKPVLHEQFIEELAIPRKYRLIIIPAASFVLVIDQQAARLTLQKLYEHLLPGGKLVMEIETPRAADTNTGVWTGRRVKRDDGATIVLSSLAEYDPLEKVERALHKYELFKNGDLLETKLEHFALRFYEIDEFRQMLAEAGFTGIIPTKPYSSLPPGERDKVVVFSGERTNGAI